MSPGGRGGQAAAVVAALRDVAGVADAEILPDRDGGPGTLRLQLEPGADEVIVATSVHRLLGDQFGLGVDAGRVQVVEEALPRRRGDAGSRPTGGPADDRAPDRTADEPADETLDDVDDILDDDDDDDDAVGDVADSADDADDVEDDPVVGSEAAGQPDAAGRAGHNGTADEPVMVAAGPGTEGPTVDTSGTPRPRWAGSEGARAVSQSAEPGEGFADPSDPADGRTRLLITRMQLVSARQGVSSEVTLELGGRPHTGTAQAATTASSVHRSVATATLRAVEDAINRPGVRLELEHVETTIIGTDRAVVVEVSMITSRGSERLTGVSGIREDARQAVIRATLDALNRRIETYLPRRAG